MEKWMIELNYRRAISQARELERQAEILSSVHKNKLPELERSIRANWEGENAQAFLRIMETLRNRISASSGQLQQTASTIRRIAWNTYQADLQSLELAQKRTY